MSDRKEKGYIDSEKVVILGVILMKYVLTIHKVSKKTEKGSEISFSSEGHKTIKGCYRSGVDMLKELSYHSEYFDILKSCYGCMSKIYEEFDLRNIGKFEIFDCQDNSFRFYIGMNIYD